jgi:multidrug resistance efflux pump
MQNVAKNFFWVAWVLVALVAGIIYYETLSPTTLLGAVEQRIHTISSVEPGVILSLDVQVGDSVTAGQPLGRIYANSVQTELGRIGAMGDVLRSQVNMREEIARFEADRTELYDLSKRIKKLQVASTKGMADTQLLAKLKTERNALSKEVSARSRMLGKQEDSWNPDAPSKDKAGKAQNAEGLVFGLTDRYLDIESRIEKGTILSPCDGQVTQVLAWTKDTVDALAPILVVEETTAEYLDAYVPENSPLPVHEGSVVSVAPLHRLLEPVGGTVTFINPGILLIPVRFSSENVQMWGRKIRIKIEPGHELIPGEKVRIHLTPDSEASLQVSGEETRNHG